MRWPRLLVKGREIGIALDALMRPYAVVDGRLRFISMQGGLVMWSTYRCNEFTGLVKSLNGLDWMVWFGLVRIRGIRDTQCSRTCQELRVACGACSNMQWIRRRLKDK